LKFVRGLTAITLDIQIDKIFGDAFNPWSLRRRAHAAIDRGLPIPAGAEFSLTGVDDPYGFASDGPTSANSRDRSCADWRPARPTSTGMAAPPDDVVDFYDARLNVGFSAQQKHDLVAFLDAL